MNLYAWFLRLQTEYFENYYKTVKFQKTDWILVKASSDQR
jgi:hypothetical protein